METAEIRRRFLEFFSSRGHTVVPSASLIFDDPNLLFVNAGMVPFMPYFLGQGTPPYKRATSVQKCVRTPDIEEVGKTTRHGTFFQMAGNFSFGDYFKEGAIELRLGAAHQVAGGRRLRLRPGADCGPPSTTTTTRRSIWRKRIAGLPAERIQRRGMADNYWSMGVPGPCGPCSEIYFDRGPEYGPDGGPDGRRGPLPGDLEPRLHAVRARRRARQGGLRRSSASCRPRTSTPAWAWSGSPPAAGRRQLYEIDEVRPVIDRAAELTGADATARDHERRRAAAGDRRPRPHRG